MSSVTIRNLALLIAGALVIAAVFVVNSGSSLAEPGGQEISVQEAYTRLGEDNLLIVDIRTEGEWRQTGIAQNALAISMEDPQFVQKIVALQTQNPGKDVAFICASSRRSGLVQSELAKNGFKGVYSVYGGMTGNGKAPGWIAEGLPTKRWSGPSS